MNQLTLNSIKASLQERGFSVSSVQPVSDKEFRFNYWKQIPEEVQKIYNLRGHEIEDDECGTLYSYSLCNS